MQNNLKTVCHRDGTVSYWSVYAQRRIDHVLAVSDEELAAMDSEERQRVISHLDLDLEDGEVSR